MRLIGIDFTCAPTRRKPITVARGSLQGARLRLERIDRLQSLEAFEQMLAELGPWLGAFDFPFGLPRVFVQEQGLGNSTAAVIEALRLRSPTRMAFRALIDDWGNGRPKGQRLLHRACDGAMPGISSSSPLQTRYVPVGFMYYEGVSRLVRSGVTLPRMHAGDASRTALEGYPGLLAFELIGRRSYKNSPEPDRLIARKDMLDALEQGRTRLALRTAFSHAQRELLADDSSGDSLDAVLCLVQAAWCSLQPGFGLPPVFDAVEGWIATAPALAA